uniref:Glycine-rich domain-containing protein n=1 Tax=Pithovirus LCPAC304 TaxID=2506594 RepID=A0A481ZC09_9VIRU|nr:MAG: hypothetical protein LCPAC304_05580 [Pithovirus LCPAC304]
MDYRRLTVGNGVGPLANEYTITVPAGAQSITVQAHGGGGGGGGQFSTIFEYNTGIIVPITQNVQAAGGGGGGRLTGFFRPYTVGNPTTLTVTVGAASPVPTDPTTGFGFDGGESLVLFTPVVAGFEQVCAQGGKGGCVSKSTANEEGFAGAGSPGGNGGGGGGGAQLLTFPTTTPLPFGVGGLGLEQESGQDGEGGANPVLGGNGGSNAFSGSPGSNSAAGINGGGGGGGSGVVVPNSGGIGGPPGDLLISNAGGDFRIQDTGAAGAGCGVYLPSAAELGTTIFKSGGLGANGLVEIWFYIFPLAT